MKNCVVEGAMMQTSGVLSRRFDVFSARCFFLTPPLPKSCPFSTTKLELRPQRLRSRGFSLRASANTEGDLSPMAPLRLESPMGQLLAQILQTHPHLLAATADQQLEDLQKQRDSSKEMSAQSSQDSLYKRIAEVKEKERRKALEEIAYCLIVGRFVENDISMIPKIPSPTSDPTGRIDNWPNQEQQFESVHSPEAFEMIISHLAFVLSERGMGPLDSIIQMSKIKLGKLYAASIMYGYFLRRVDERYQLERSMNTLPKDFGEDRVKSFDEPKNDRQLWDPNSLIRIYPDEMGGGGIVDSSYTEEEKSPELRSYVMYLDPETLQRYATLRSKEAMSLIEKQTQALFGRPDITVTEDGSLNASNDEVVSLAFSGLTMLVLEAVSFGSFLWDAESYMETKYQFLGSS